MNQFDFKKAHEREAALEARVNDLAKKVESFSTRENLTESEKNEMERETENLKSANAQLLSVRSQIMANTAHFEINSREDVPSVAKQMREAIANGQRFEVKVKREFGGNTSDRGHEGGVALSENPDVVYKEQIVEPMYEASILGKIGCPMRTGLSGNHVYPVVEAFHVSLAQEAVALGDTKINTSKLWAKPERAGVAVPITRQALNETEDLLQTIFTEYAPAAIAELQNKVICSSTAVNNATSLFGPFVTMKSGHSIQYNGAIPTAAELLSLPAKVANTKVQMQWPAFIMNIDMKTKYALTPAWEGAQKSVLDAIAEAGYPVVTCTEVAATEVLFGDFKYFPLDIFGEFRITIDPYSKSREDAIDCVLNFDMAGTVLRQEAFAKLHK